jgi:hypothetical protein
MHKSYWLPSIYLFSSSYSSSQSSWEKAFRIYLKNNRYSLLVVIDCDNDCCFIKTNILIIRIKHMAIHNVIISNNFIFGEETVIVCSICFVIYLEKIKMNSSLRSFSLSLDVCIQYPIEWNNIRISFNE